MKKFKSLMYVVACATLVSACSNNKSAPLEVPPPPKERVSVGGPEGVELEPAKAEILFVIDNSKSMTDHINNVSANIDSFVDSFAGRSSLEFNIGVTTVYDSRTFHSATFQRNFAGTAAIRPNGQFFPLGGLQAMQEAIEDRSKTKDLRFFLKHTDTDLKPKLKQLLKVGVQDLENGGPEVEEVLSPLQAIYGLRANARVKPQGFSKGRDSYKIFFFVTDAADNSKFDVDQFYVELVAAAANGQREKIMAFGALVPVGAQNCKDDPGVENDRLERFLHSAQPVFATRRENIASLCSGFGPKFAKFGDMIRQQTSQYRIELPSVPDFSSPDSEEQEIGIFVTYGSQRLLLKDKAYAYDPESRTITIDPDAIKEHKAGARFHVSYMPITDYDRKAHAVVAAGLATTDSGKAAARAAATPAGSSTKAGK